MNVILTGIEGVQKDQLILTVFPNPNNGNFKLWLENVKSGEYLFRIINELGQINLIKKVFITGRIHEEIFKLPQLAKGNYIIIVTNDQVIITQKVTIQ